MQALPIVQSAPQNQDVSAQTSSAPSSGSDFKSMLQSSASKSSETNNGSKTDKSGDNQSTDKSLQDKTAQQPGLPAALMLDGKGIEKKSVKPEQKSDAKKDAKTDPSVLAAPLVAANMPLQQNAKTEVKPASSDASAKAISPDGALKKTALSAQGNEAAKTADIAQTGNNLPPKETKDSFSRTMSEKQVLPETKKTSDNPISLQPTTVSSDAKSIPKLTVNAPVSSPQWANEVGQKVAWMSSSGNHVAELHLNPPNLGPVEVKLTVHNDQATIQFVAQHHETRAALESALPRLKEMMMDSGIALGNASVDSGSSQQQSGFAQQDQSRQHQSAFSVTESAIRMSRSLANLGNIDTFA